MGELTKSSLAIERPRFWQLSKWVQEEIYHQKLSKYIIGKEAFGGLGEQTNASLATERPEFQQLAN